MVWTVGYPEIHINSLTKKCRQLSGWIFSVFHTRNRLIMLTLFNSLVRSRMEFCCEIWCPYKIKQIVQIEQIQRSFTVKIAGMSNFNYWEILHTTRYVTSTTTRVNYNSSFMENSSQYYSKQYWYKFQNSFKNFIN